MENKEVRYTTNPEKFYKAYEGQYISFETADIENATKPDFSKTLSTEKDGGEEFFIEADEKARTEFTPISLCKDLWQQYPKEIIGFIVGLLIGISILIFGFGAVFFVCFCGVLGIILSRANIYEPEFWHKLARKVQHESD